MASRFTAGLFWSLKAVLSTQNFPGFLDSTADSSQQSPWERYQADQRSSLVSAQAGSWVQVTRWGRKATSSCRECPRLPPQRRKGWEGEAAGSYPGPHTHALCSGTGLPDYGALWLHLLSALDRQRTVLKKIFFFLKKTWKGETDGYVLEPTEWLKGSQTSSGVWREDTGLLSRQCMKIGRASCRERV